MTETTNKTVVEYVEPQKKPVSALGAVGATLGGAALLGVAGNTVGNIFNRYFGPNSPGVVGAAPAFMPAVAPAYVPPVVNAFSAAINEGGYVTKEQLCLVREVASKDSIIAQLTAEKYADNAVKDAIAKTEAKYDRQLEKMDWKQEKLETEVCDLQKAVAVNTVSDQDYRRFADRVYVHQPKATMRERIVTCEDPCGCCCGNGKNDCGHNNWQ